MKVLGWKLRDLRKEKNWTQEELADRSGVNAKTISDMENGNGNHYRDTVQRVANTLGVQIDELVADDLSNLESLVMSATGRRHVGNRSVEIWTQTIYDGRPDKGGRIVKQDMVRLVYLTEQIMQATITRLEPRTDQHWMFWGRKVDNQIFGHYWRTVGEGSNGVILLRKKMGIEPELYSGFYGKIHQEELDGPEARLYPKKIDLDWRFDQYE